MESIVAFETTATEEPAAGGPESRRAWTVSIGSTATPASPLSPSAIGIAKEGGARCPRLNGRCSRRVLQGRHDRVRSFRGFHRRRGVAAVGFEPFPAFLSVGCRDGEGLEVHRLHGRHSRRGATASAAGDPDRSCRRQPRSVGDGRRFHHRCVFDQRRDGDTRRQIVCATTASTWTVAFAARSRRKLVIDAISPRFFGMDDTVFRKTSQTFGCKPSSIAYSRVGAGWSGRSTGF